MPRDAVDMSGHFDSWTARQTNADSMVWYGRERGYG